MKELLEIFWYWILVMLWFLLSFIVLFILTVKPLQYMKCHQMYNDSQYKIIWWCMIKYNWEYIPEHLYIKAFEQNINLK